MVVWVSAAELRRSGDSRPGTSSTRSLEYRASSLAVGVAFMYNFPIGGVLLAPGAGRSAQGA